MSKFWRVPRMEQRCVWLMFSGRLLFGTFYLVFEDLMRRFGLSFPACWSVYWFAHTHSAQANSGSPTLDLICGTKWKWCQLKRLLRRQCLLWPESCGERETSVKRLTSDSSVHCIVRYGKINLLRMLLIVWENAAWLHPAPENKQVKQSGQLCLFIVGTVESRIGPSFKSVTEDSDVN